MCLSFNQKREAVWAERGREEENKLVAFLAFSCAENGSHASVSVNIPVPKSKSKRAHAGAPPAAYGSHHQHILLMKSSVRVQCSFIAQKLNTPASLCSQRAPSCHDKQRETYFSCAV